MYKQEKVLQVIGRLLVLNGGRMNLLKLMKELYLIDRLSIQERNTSVSGDSHVSMKWGPVLSTTCTILDDLCTQDSKNAWSEYLSTEKTKYYPDIILKAPIGTGMLSKNDNKYIEQIFDEYKEYNDFDLARHTHSFQEWKETYTSSMKIKFSEIMKALGKSSEEIEVAKAEYRQINDLYELLETK